MTINILELDQVCNITQEVYFDIVDHFGIAKKCIEHDPDIKDGTFGYSYYCDLSKEDEHIIIEFCDMNNYRFDKHGNPIHQLTL